MKSISSSASLTNFLNANDDISDDELSLENCADKQAKILHQAKRIETFIKQKGNSQPHDTCFKLLCILFDLFKSEVSSNLSLREALMTYKTNERLSEEYENQLTRLFSAVKKYDPTVSSLNQILSLFQRKISIHVPEKLSEQVDQAKHDIEKLNQEFEDKQMIYNRTQKQLDQMKTDFETESSEKENNLQKLKNEERKLKENLIQLQKENSELLERQNQMKKEEDPRKLKETIEYIDGKMNELQQKIQLITKQHKKKIGDLRAKINKYETRVVNLRRDRSTIEIELDKIHKEIDIITNPFTHVKDETKSLHLARINFERIKEEYLERQKQFQSEQEEIDVLKENVQALETTLTSMNNKLERSQKELSELQNDFDQKQIILQEVEEKRKTMKNISSKKREIDEIKRHADAENLRLNQELEAAKKKCQQYAIDNDLLEKTLNNLDMKKRELALMNQKQNLTDNDLQRLDHVANSFEMIKSSLDIPQFTTVEQITDHILQQMP